MRILSIQAGAVRQLGRAGAEDPLEQPWTSAIYKLPVTGRVWSSQTGLAGDAQADLRVHGGPERALLGYAAEHYPMWRAALDKVDVGPGGFGENLTLEDANEELVCVGDVVQAGEVRLQVSQPRQPCQNLARKFHVPDMVKRVLDAGAFGWYYRVQQEGWLETGMELTLLDRPYPQWTIREAARVMRRRNHERAAAERLARCPALSDGWRATLLALSTPAP